jgi:thiol:disulfide interchange protein
MLIALLVAYGGRQKKMTRPLAVWIFAALFALNLVASTMALSNRDKGTVTASGSSFSTEALAKARATGKPVFVYFTADWCLSCKANEAGAINREAVQDAFKEKGVVTLVGDWTNGDPAITRTLAEHGRNSVPLYLWYAPGAAQPEILPQILTPATLTDLAG